MATLTGFTRPTDPIESSGLAAKISLDIGTPVTVEITATDVLVTGTITEGNRTAIQASMTAYFYAYLQMGAPLSDNPDMSGNRHNMGVSEHAAFTSDSALQSQIATKADATAPTANASQSSVTHTFNTAFRPSATRNAIINYSVSIANVLTLTGGAAGVIILEISPNSSFTAGTVQELGRVSNSNTGGLVVGLTLNDAIGLPMLGWVPAGYYVRLRTSNTTGTPTYTYQSGQEILL